MPGVRLDSAAGTEAHGARVGRALRGRGRQAGLVIVLEGELGAGKTTWVRGVLRGLGWSERVRSPTYTLVEPYRAGGRDVYHMDLYRLADPEELEMLGVRDFAEPDSVWLVEWPERGGSLLPTPDLGVHLSHAGEGRRISVIAHTAAGHALLAEACLGIESPEDPE